jgi:putative copper export protein
MSLWYLISVWLHIICAAFWIGGMLFLPLVLLPGIKQHPDRVALLYKTGITFRFYGWLVLFVLLLTGLTNMYGRGIPLTIEFLKQSGYGRLLAYKLALFSLILLISGAHDFVFGKKALEEVQHNPDPRLRLVARWSGRLNLLLALVMAFLGVALSRGGSLG